MSREKTEFILKLDLYSLNCSVRDTGRTTGKKKKKAFPRYCIPLKFSCTEAGWVQPEEKYCKTSAWTEFFLTLRNIMADKEVDHFGRRMPSFLNVTVDYFGFRRQECPFNIWPGLYLRAALHGSGKTDNFLIPSSAGGWGSNFQTGHLLTLEKWHYYVYKFTNLRIKKPLLLLLLHRPRTTTSSKQTFRGFSPPPPRNGFFLLSADRFPREEVNRQRVS